MSQFFTSCGQSIGDAALVSVLPATFRIDFLQDGLVGSPCSPRDYQATQGILQRHSSKASILWHSAFIMVQRSYPYMTTGKTIALTRWMFVSKVMSLLFNALSRLIIPFLPRSKCLLISWLQSPSAVVFQPKKIKSVTVSIFFCIYLLRSDGTRCHDLSFLNIEF